MVPTNFGIISDWFPKPENKEVKKLVREKPIKSDSANRFALYCKELLDCGYAKRSHPIHALLVNMMNENDSRFSSRSHQVN